MSHEDRVLALQLAAHVGGDPATQVVPAAEAFLAFLVGGEAATKSPTDKVRAGLDAATPPVDAGSKPDAEIPVAAGVREPVPPKPVPSAKVAKDPDDGKTVAKPPTQDDVRAALREYAEREGQGAAMEVLAKFDSTNITKLDEKHYAAVVKACAPF